MGWILRLAGILFLALVVTIGWLYRHELLGALRPGRPAAAEAEAATGRPGRDALARARDKIDSLNGWRADSVVLTPDEMAAVIAAGLERLTRGQLESLAVRLEDDRLVVSALARTTEIPRETLGPLAGALDEWEPVEAAGTLSVARPGWAAWRVEALALRDIPLPRAAIAELVAQILPDAEPRTIPLRIPDGIGDLRVRPDGVTLYGGSSSS